MVGWEQEIEVAKFQHVEATALRNPGKLTDFFGSLVSGVWSPKPTVDRVMTTK